MTTQSHVIGRTYEYRVRDFFRKAGWKSERNPLSGASDQIEEELGKHDVRSWREDFNIFLQIECKKTNDENGILGIKKEWIDKIDFNNDEILVFSYLRCSQDFIFIPKEFALDVIKSMKLKLLQTHVAKGGTIFGFKKEWLEHKDGEYCIVEFLEREWAAFDLVEYVKYREKFKVETKATTFADKIKSISSIDDLKKLRAEDEANWKTKDWKSYYSKLDRLESGDVSYNPSFIKEGQWWLPEDKKFDWDKNTVESIMKKVKSFVNVNLEENEEEDMVWINNKDISEVEKEIKKILGFDKRDKKNDSKSGKQKPKGTS